VPSILACNIQPSPFRYFKSVAPEDGDAVDFDVVSRQHRVNGRARRSRPPKARSYTALKRGRSSRSARKTRHRTTSSSDAPASRRIDSMFSSTAFDLCLDRSVDDSIVPHRDLPGDEDEFAMGDYPRNFRAAGGRFWAEDPDRHGFSLHGEVVCWTSVVGRHPCREARQLDEVSTRDEREVGDPVGQATSGHSLFDSLGDAVDRLPSTEGSTNDWPYRGRNAGSGLA
jgi:hypothetical protein